MVREGSVNTRTLGADQEIQTQRWVQDEWPRIKHQLLREHGWQVITDPDFAEPGKAIFHCPRVITRGKPSVPDEHTEVTAWDMTPLPADNASQVAARLNKGCLFQQPHIDSVFFIGIQEDPVPEPGPGPDLKYHHQIGQDVYNFQTWDGFINFMNHRKLPISKENYPPKRIEELERFQWVCWQHNLGFNNEHLCNQHIRESLRQGGRAVHMTPSEMQVSQEHTLSAGNPTGPERGHKENINA